MLKTSAAGFVYFSDVKNGRQEDKMGHLACFSGVHYLVCMKNYNNALYATLVCKLQTSVACQDIETWLD